MDKATIAKIRNQLSTAAQVRAQERAEAYAKAHRDNWDFPETVGKEDHRDRLRRFSGELRVITVIFSITFLPSFS